VLRWCLDAAKESGLKPGDYMGGFAIDEMKPRYLLNLE